MYFRGKNKAKQVITEIIFSLTLPKKKSLRLSERLQKIAHESIMKQRKFL